MRPRMLVSPYGCRPRGQVVVPREVVWHPPRAARLSGAESGEGRYATDPVRVLCVRAPRSRPSRPDLLPLPQRDDRHEIPSTADRHVPRLPTQARQRRRHEAMTADPAIHRRSRACAARPGFAGHRVVRRLAQKGANYVAMRSRRADVTLAAVILVWLAAAAAVYLASCQLHGYDDTMCRAYHACSTDA